MAKRVKKGRRAARRYEARPSIGRLNTILIIVALLLFALSAYVMTLGSQVAKPSPTPTPKVQIKK